MRFQEWEIRGFDRDLAVKLCKEGINPLVSVFLTSRGIMRAEEAYNFLKDDISTVCDPFLLTDMDKAVKFINEAVTKGTRIAIYGDYDVDGMTSSALLMDYLRSRGADPEIYIPGRFDEGYGLSLPAIDALKERGVELIITVDCGITAIEEAKYARGLGIGLIITDHHECKEELPNALAVINPKRPGCRYPNKSLAGVGVAFKLVCALESRAGTEEVLRRYGDLVAIGTVADVMPVIGENRALIRQGLSVLNRNARPGIQRLARESCVERGGINTAAIGFALAPRLNAAGRMGQTSVSIDLLLTSDAIEAERLTLELCRLNSERRRLETEIFEEALSMLKGVEPSSPIVLAYRDWYQGVMGIVAARISEKYCLPAVMISIDSTGRGRGSCRSFGSFGLYGALQSCGDILENYGGHEMAAGITVAEDKIDELRRRLGEYYKKNVAEPHRRKLRIDFEAEKPELLSLQNVAALEGLEPFGNQNLPPVLCIKGARLVNAVSVGAGKHSRLRIEKAGKNLDCIYFSMPAEELGVSEGMPVDVAFEPQINEFRGRSSVQLHVFDIRPSGK